jgi:hypothetical protein
MTSTPKIRSRVNDRFDSPPSMDSSSQSADADYYGAKIASGRQFKQSSPNAMLADTVAGMQKVASETFHNIQEWAQSPQNVSRGSTSTRQNEPKASIKLFSDAEMRPKFGESKADQPIPALFGYDLGPYEALYIYKEEKTTEDETKDGSILNDFTRRLSACTGGVPNLSKVKQAVGDVRAAWACGQGDEQEYFPQYFPHPTSGASITSLDEEDLRVRRLTSWGTIGTIDTSYSEATLIPHQLDDDGNTIDPKILEKMMSEKRQSQRKRTVKFDYPPISSLRECPRHDPNDLPRLFFTEEELDQIEDDRENTEVADDIEVVAVSSSISFDNPSSPSFASSESGKSKQSLQKAPSVGGYASNVPRVWSKRKGGGTYFSFSQSQDAKSTSSKPDDSNRGRTAQRNEPSKPRRRAGTPRRGAGPGIVEEREGSRKQEDQRLIKSVQIYLRERSTAK